MDNTNESQSSEGNQSRQRQQGSPEQLEQPEQALASATAAAAAASPPASAPSHFPDKLMALLEKKVAPDAVWWLRDMGKIKGAFAINRRVFTKKVLDTAFNGNKWPSITRNFNRWGYRQVSYPNLPSHTTAYQHPLFQPNRPDLLRTMTQNKSQAKAAAQALERKIASESSTGIVTGPATSATSPTAPSPTGSESRQLMPPPMESPSNSHTWRPPPLDSTLETPTSLGSIHQQPPRASGPAAAASASSSMQRLSRSLPHRGSHNTPSTHQTAAQPQPQPRPREGSSSSSSGASSFDLFPNQQLQDVLLPNMNMDSQAMLQSVLARQEEMGTVPHVNPVIPQLSPLLQRAPLSPTVQANVPPPPDLLADHQILMQNEQEHQHQHQQANNNNSLLHQQDELLLQQQQLRRLEQQHQERLQQQLMLIHQGHSALQQQQQLPAVHAVPQQGGQVSLTLWQRHQLQQLQQQQQGICINSLNNIPARMDISLQGLEQQLMENTLAASGQLQLDTANAAAIAQAPQQQQQVQDGTPPEQQEQLITQILLERQRQQQEQDREAQDGCGQQ
ncbi:HSF-type DNA-binding [Seminavis robusta]|uniref:HSF-type DNA-binding n=1 Tax=Seminavis robusta TaxID=568900 RepID=A0A9N8HH30_9STRA|nr:HSF-type DNA-binding [Seminavis robusta]|eukprot:Sro428_g140810.1 HSF-type DNA-binding (562) ;mRNA; r:13948-15998